MLNITHQFSSVAQSRLGCHVLHQCMKVKSESEVKKKKKKKFFSFFFLFRKKFQKQWEFSSSRGMLQSTTSEVVSCLFKSMELGMAGHVLWYPS